MLASSAFARDSGVSLRFDHGPGTRMAVALEQRVSEKTRNFNMVVEVGESERRERPCFSF